MDLMWACEVCTEHAVHIQLFELHLSESSLKLMIFM